jgi:hypothetical protein
MVVIGVEAVGTGRRTKKPILARWLARTARSAPPRPSALVQHWWQWQWFCGDGICFWMME